MIWFSGRRPSIEAINAMRANTLLDALGIEAVDAGDDWLRMRMPVDARTHQVFGRLHGGASVALAETVGSVAAGLCIDPEHWSTVGLEINANHLRPAHDGYVHGTARPENVGRTIQVWSIRIEDDAGKLVCISRFTVAVIPKDRR